MDRLGCRTARQRWWHVCLGVAKVSVHCLGRCDGEVWERGEREREEENRTGERGREGSDVAVNKSYNLQPVIIMKRTTNNYIFMKGFFLSCSFFKPACFNLHLFVLSFMSS